MENSSGGLLKDPEIGVIARAQSDRSNPAGPTGLLRGFAPRNDSVTLGWIVAGGMLLRCLGLFRPLLGNFSSVQVIYASMARNFADYDWNPFLPRLDFLMNGVPSVRLLDLPWNSWLVGMTHAALGMPIDVAGRLLSVLASALAIVMLYRWVGRLADAKTGLFAAGVFAFSPMAIVYGQSFMTDVLALALVLTSFDAVTRYLTEGRRGPWHVAWGSMALALLLRVQAAYVLGVVLLLFVVFRGWRSLIGPRCWGLVLLALIPAAGWVAYCGWADAHRNDILMGIFHQLTPKSFASYSLMGSVFWKALLAHGSRALTPIGLGLLALGLARGNAGKAQSVFGAWFLMTLVYFCLFTKKVVDMNYYVLWIVPASAFFMAGGWTYLIGRGWVSARVLSGLLACTVGAGFVLYALAPAYKTPAADRHVVRAGLYADTHLPKDARIIAKNGGSNNLLYYSRRYGWKIGVRPHERQFGVYQEHDRRFYSPEEYARRLEVAKDPIAMLEYLREKGAAYLISVDFAGLRAEKAFFAYLERNYPLMHREEGFELFDLRGKQS